MFMFEVVEKVTVCEPALMLPSLKKKKFRQALFFYTAKVSLSCTDIESRHAQMYSRILMSNPRTGLSQPRRKQYVMKRCKLV